MTTLAWYMDSAAEARGTGAWERALNSYEASLARVPKEGDAEVTAEILRAIGTVHYNRGDFESAREVFTASLAIAEMNRLGEQTEAALNCLAAVEQFNGGIDEAEALYLRAHTIAHQRGNERRAAMIEQNLATLANVRGEVEVALARYRSALDRFERLGEERAAARVLQNMGMAYVDLEAWAMAERCFDEATHRALTLDDQETLATIDINRAELHLRRGRYEEAREACDWAMERYGRSQSKAGIGEACKVSGMIYRETGKLQLAQLQFELGETLARLCGDRLLEAEIAREWAVLLAEKGFTTQARETLGRARELFESLHATRERLDVDARLAALPEA